MEVIKMSYNIYGLEYTATKLVDVLDRFIMGEAKTAEYVYPESDYANSYSAANALRTAAKRQRMNNVKVSTRNGRVFMTKTI